MSTAEALEAARIAVARRFPRQPGIADSWALIARRDGADYRPCEAEDFVNERIRRDYGKAHGPIVELVRAILAENRENG